MIRQEDGHVRFTESEETTIAGALRVAAEQYDHDALAMRTVGNMPLSNQFARQADESRRLADCLEA